MLVSLAVAGRDPATSSRIILTYSQSTHHSHQTPSQQPLDEPLVESLAKWSSKVAATRCNALGPRRGQSCPRAQGAGRITAPSAAQPWAASSSSWEGTTLGGAGSTPLANATLLPEAPRLNQQPPPPAPQALFLRLLCHCLWNSKWLCSCLCLVGRQLKSQSVLFIFMSPGPGIELDTQNVDLCLTDGLVNEFIHSWTHIYLLHCMAISIFGS